MNYYPPPWTFHSSTTSAPAYGFGSGTSTSAGSQPQTTQAPPKRNKWSKLNDPSLELKYGSKERALDAEEFPKRSPANLCEEDREHWRRLRKTLLDLPAQASNSKNDHSYNSRLSQIRRILRRLKEVSNGTSERFPIRDHTIRAKPEAAANIAGQESGQGAGHGIREARESQTVSAEEFDAGRHEKRRRREAEVAVADAATHNAPMDFAIPKSRRSQIAPRRIHGREANARMSLAAKGPGQLLHERVGWMGVVCGPSPAPFRGDGSFGRPIVLD